MQIESSSVSVRNLTRAKWLSRLALAVLWLAGGAFVALSPDRTEPLTACGTPIYLLGATSLLLALRPGRSAAGDRVAGMMGTVAVGDGDVLVELASGRRLRFPRGDLVAGWTEPDMSTDVAMVAGWAEPGGDVAVLQTRSGME